MNTKIDIGKVFSDAFDIFKQNAVLLIVTMLIAQLVGSATFSICTGGLTIAFFAICLRLIDGDANKPEIGDIFKGFAFTLPGLVFSIVGGLGAMVCCIGALITMPVCCWAMMRFADNPSLTMGDTLKEMFNLIFKEKMWILVLLQIIVGIVSSLGFIICYVGLIVTVPFACLMLACAYRQVYPKAEVLPPPSEAAQA